MHPLSTLPTVGHTSQLWKCMDITDQDTVLHENKTLKFIYMDNRVLCPRPFSLTVRLCESAALQQVQTSFMTMSMKS